MKDRDSEFAMLWIVKAEHDLVTAERTLSMDDPPTDTPCFHAQQAVEKSFKAFLTFKHVEFKRTHDLLVLLDMVGKFTEQFVCFREMLADMNSYSVETRYPMDGIDPSMDEASQAVQTARQITEMLKSILVEK